MAERIRAALGIAIGALAGFVLAAAAPATATGITITSGTCSGGGTSFCFTPEAESVQTGVVVTWTDQSGVAHQMQSCTPSACPGSPSSTGAQTFSVFVAADGRGSFTFTAAGTYYYYCSIHGYAAMHGSITVTQAATPPPPTSTPRPTLRPTPRPTHKPSMRPVPSTPKTGAGASSSLGTTASTTPPKAAIATPSAAPPAGSPTPLPRATAAVTPGGSPVLPIAIVLILVAAFGALWYLLRRRNTRQAR